MGNPLFSGQIEPDHRIRHVTTMMGYAPASLDYPRDFIERVLSKAEDIAYEFLCKEISEAKRGEQARKKFDAMEPGQMSAGFGKRYREPWG